MRLFHHELWQWYLGNLGICFTASGGGDGFGNINVGYTFGPTMQYIEGIVTNYFLLLHKIQI